MEYKTDKLQNLKVNLEKITFYACSICNKCFLSENELHKHLEVHAACLKIVSQPMYNHMTSASIVINRLKSYECDKCLMTFRNKQELFLHVVTHLNYIDLNPNASGSYIKKFKCSECDAMFVAESTLKAHGIVHEPIPHPCTICDVAFYQRNDLKSHMNIVHEKELNDIRVQLQLKKEESSRKILAEKNYRQQETPKKSIKPKLKATLDLSKTKSKSKSKKSKVRRRRIQPKPPKNYLKLQSIDGKFDCPICKESFYTKNCVFAHVVERHEGPDTNPCNNCHKIYLTADLYETHLTSCLNGDANAFICDYCSKAMQTKQSLEKHISTHLGGKFRCNICNNGYTQSHNLKRHLSSVHKVGERVQYKCDVCDKLFAAKSYLVRHKIIHSGTRPYQCEFCEKTFTDPSAKQRHLRLHTKEKPYSCKYCEKTFNDVGQCRIHILRHEGKRNHICTMCDRKFYTLGDLKSHFLTHTDIMPYHCDDCGRKFQNKAYLSSHIYRQHLQFPYCKKCSKKFNSKAALKVHKKVGCKERCRYTVPQFLPVEE